MARKVFISVLGSSNYGYCQYVRGEYISDKVRYIQEATLDYLLKEEKWTNSDVAYILLTKGPNGSEIKNWLDNGHGDGLTGLKSQLDAMNLPFPCIPIGNLPAGNNEKEIWEIFTQVFNRIEDGDELYFDLTHGFRYIPMLILVLGNYCKFLKNIRVRSITYGNFEGRDRENNLAPVIDLLPLSALQDWSYAAGQYLDNGNVDKLTELCEFEYKPILKETRGADANARALRNFTNSLRDVIDERNTCRGMSIIRSNSFKALKTDAENVEDTFIEPLNPIFKKIKESFLPFDENENIMNGYSAAVWCFQNNLFQQSATILQEFVVSHICSRHGIQIDNEKERHYINTAFNYSFYNTEEKDWKGPEDTEKLREILSDDIIKDKVLAGAFKNLTEVRNDYNHSGMRSQRAPLKPAQIKDNIKKCLDIFSVLLNESEVKNTPEAKLLINLSNHPSGKWCEKQFLRAKEQFGEIMDIQFPNIDPYGTEEYIKTLAQQYFENIMQYTENYNVTVHIMGEMTFCYALINLLNNKGIKCVASTSERVIEVLDDGSKRVVFEFERFRAY